MSYRSEIGFREDPYAESARIALKVRRPKCSKKLDHHTYLEWNDVFDGVFFIRLHKTRILEFHSDGRIVLNSGGWRTVTTKDRMNKFLPYDWSVSQDQGIWYLCKKTDNWHYVHKITRERKEDIHFDDPDYDQYENVHASYDEHPFDDFITIHADGSVTGQGEDPNAQRKIRNKIRRYARKFADAFAHGEVPAPSAGDCTYCSMTDENDKPVGKALKDNDHFLSHMKESYFVPSLLVRASNTVATSAFYKQMLFNWMAKVQPGNRIFFSPGDYMQREVSKILSSYLCARFKLTQRRTCTAVG